MVILILSDLTQEDIIKAREDYHDYLKITVDIAQQIAAIGGEYHADAEALLVEQCQSKNKDIWGGGYNLITHKFETNAVVNLKPPANDSTEILDPEVRQSFLNIAQEKLSEIENLI